MGSKNRLAKYLVPILTKELTEDRWYVEPFAGGMNMIDKINHDKRLANDYNNYLIAMWRFLVEKPDFKFPTTIPKELYDTYREMHRIMGIGGNGDTKDEAMIGWIGFAGSFNGRFFDGGYSSHNSNGRDYIREQINNILSQVKKMEGTKFLSFSYDKLDIPANSVIYCDPLTRKQPVMNPRKDSIMTNFGIGVERKQKKDIPYSFQNTRLQRILLVYGRKK